MVALWIVECDTKPIQNQKTNTLYPIMFHTYRFPSIGLGRVKKNQNPKNLIRTERIPEETGLANLMCYDDAIVLKRIRC